MKDEEAGHTTVLVPLAEGFEEIEAVTILDVLRRAGYNVISFSVTGDLWIEGAHKIRVQADVLFDEADFSAANAIVLPGGMPGTANLARHEGLRAVLLDLNREGRLIGAICAAPMVLGQLGILRGIPATCYPGFGQYLEGCSLMDQGIVHHGNIVTGKGAGYALEFALKLVALLSGEEQAGILAEKLLAAHPQGS